MAKMVKGFRLDAETIEMLRVLRAKEFRDWFGVEPESKIIEQLIQEAFRNHIDSMSV